MTRLFAALRTIPWSKYLFCFFLTRFWRLPCKLPNQNARTVGGGERPPTVSNNDLITFLTSCILIGRIKQKPLQRFKKGMPKSKQFVSPWKWNLGAGRLCGQMSCNWVYNGSYILLYRSLPQTEDSDYLWSEILRFQTFLSLFKRGIQYWFQLSSYKDILIV